MIEQQEVNAQTGGDAKQAKSKLAGFTIERVVRDSDYCTVYQAFDAQINQHVIIDVIKPKAFTHEFGQQLFDGLQQELKILKECKHQNFVQLYDYELHKEFAYFIFEKVNTFTLHDLIIHDKQLSLQNIVLITLQILSVLKHIHDKSIIHTNLHPGNIYLFKNRKIKINYLDIEAYVASHLRHKDSLANVRQHYHSPEQLQRGDLDRRTDIYTICMILLELIARSNYRNTTMAPLFAHEARDTEKGLELINDAVPDQFKEFIKMGMTANKEYRFRDVDHFSSLLLKVYKDFLITHEKMANPDYAARIKTNANYYLDDQGTIVWRAPILDMIDRNYSEFIGPLSNMMVQKESRKHTDINPLLDSLAEKIESRADRNQFIKRCLEEYKRMPIGRDEAFDQMDSAAKQKVSSDSLKQKLLTADALATLEQQFTWYVGPIAQILIEKTLHEVETRTDLYRELAKHIPLEADRIQFMNNMVL